MSVYTLNDISQRIKAAAQGDIRAVYLIHGERYLCRNAADDLLNMLLPDPAARVRCLHEIDGDQEDFGRTLNQLRTYGLFAGRQVLRVTDSKLFLTKGTAKSLWDKVSKAYAAKEIAQAVRSLGQFFEVSGVAPDDISPGEVDSYSPNQWKTLFGFSKPQENPGWFKEVVTLLQQKSGGEISASRQNSQASERFMLAFSRGIPENNTLVLLTETVDKRDKFYKFIKEHGDIFDLTVESGAGKAARTQQETIIKDLVQKTLAGFGKKMEPKGLQMLLDRVGFHPVAVVHETEKLALYAGDAPTITITDINDIIGRTREEALYELTECISARQLAEALVILCRLLANGIHALAILATLRNHLKKMLLISCAQQSEQPLYKTDIPYPAFQNKYLPALKEGREDWSSLWVSHPYGLFVLFRQTAKFSSIGLQRCLEAVLTAEYRLKGSPIPARLVLEDLLISFMRHSTSEMDAS